MEQPLAFAPKKIKLAPSILSADFGKLAEQISEVETAGADILHVDVMDGHFVPNLTIGPVVVKWVKKYTNLPLDVHLMVTSPKDFLEEFAKAGADRISFHLEAAENPDYLMRVVSALQIEVGLAINPQTPINYIIPYLDKLDFVIVMSVNPGFGGQPFIPESLAKVSELKKVLMATKTNLEIEVDGGVSAKNADLLAAAGADVLVAGSAIFSQPNIRKAVQDIRDCLTNQLA